MTTIHILEQHRMSIPGEQHGLWRKVLPRRSSLVLFSCLIKLTIIFAMRAKVLIAVFMTSIPAHEGHP